MKNSYYLLKNNVKIPKVGFGTWQITNHEECVNSVKVALKAGYRHIDTAAAYGNEQFIKEAIEQSEVKREEIFITSKLPAESKGYDITMKEFDDSIKRLGTTYLDLYLIHAPRPWGDKSDVDYTNLNIESWRAMIDLYNQGKIRSIGVSNFSPKDIDALIKATNFIPHVNQISLRAGYVQEENKKYCDAHNILIEAYCPLGSGKVFSNEKIKEIADKNKVSVAQLCIKWCLDYGTLPLPKSVHEDRIYNNIDLDFVINEEDYKDLFHV